MKVTIISGSARKGNNTLRVARAFQKLMPGSVLVDFQEYDIPSLAENFVSKASETKFQTTLIKAIDDCDLLLVLTPEYNWFPSAEIVNMIHQLGTNEYASIFDNKVIANIGVSVGRGGRMPAVQLGYVFNKIINFFNLNSITSPKTFEAQEVLACISKDGELLSNDVFNAGIQNFLEYSLKVAQRWHLNS